MDDLDRLYHRLVLNVRDGAPHLLDRQFRLGDVAAHLVPYRHTRRELGFESIQQYELALLRLASGERGYLRAEGSVQDALRRTLAEPQPDGSLLRSYADAPVALPPDALTRARVAPPEGEADTGGAATRDATGTTPAVEVPHVPSLAATQLSARLTPGATHLPVPAAADLERAVVASSQAAAAWSEASRAASRSATPAAAPATPAPTPPSAAPPAAGPGTSMTNPTPHQSTPSAAHAPGGAGTCRYCGQPLPEGRRITFCPYCGNNVTVLQCPACSTELEVGWKFCITCGRAMDDAAFAPGGGGGGAGETAGTPPRSAAER